jgi:uracil-DNA glycosylase
MTKITMQLDWYQALAHQFDSDDMAKISKGIDIAIHKHGVKSVFPIKELMFKAFEKTPLTTCKAVMIGLEPTADTASGLFLESTHAPIDGMNEKLVKVFKVYCKDYPDNFNTSLMSGSTTEWAESGVLMLNLSLTARAGQTNRHLMHWAFFVNKVLEVLKQGENPIAFIPLGKTPIATIEHLEVPLPHRVFVFEEEMFLNVNKWLISVGREPIEW